MEAGVLLSRDGVVSAPINFQNDLAERTVGESELLSAVQAALWSASNSEGAAVCAPYGQTKPVNAQRTIRPDTGEVRTADDARDMRRLRVQVTIRGSKAGDVLPHVNYGYGTYRGDTLNPRTDLVGEKFDGFIEDEDARYLTLLDEHGLPRFTLQTLPPYARTPHTLAERKRAEKLKRSSPARWEGIDDLIEAYHADVRECARHLKWAADEVASGAVPRVPTDRPPAPSSGAAQTLAGLPPRGGPVNLRRR